MKLVCSGAGAAALACLDLLVSLGLPMENIWVSDIKGVVYNGRKEEMDDDKARYAKDTKARTLADVIAGADIFLGLVRRRRAEAGDGEARWAPKPLILALANPEPEILPDEAKAVRPRRDHRHRALGLSEPGQQRAVLSVHFPRRARCRRDDHHRSR